MLNFSSNNNQIAFTTDRLEAHFLTPANKNLVIDLYSKKENSRFLKGLDAKKDIELAFACYKNYQNLGAYLIFTKAGEFIGFGGVQNQEPLNDGSFALLDDIEFLIMLDSPYSGQGYAKEFSLAFLNFFLQNSKKENLAARVSKENLSCLKLLQNIGFKMIGETSYHEINNKFHLLRFKR